MNQLTVSSSPHIRTEETTRTIMSDVAIAMIPALVMGVYYFGVRALVLTLISVISCVGFEALYQKLLHKPITAGDFSAVVTGMLIAFNVPVAATWWMMVIAAFVAIVICKQLFGGLGKNFINPALGGRAFLMASWASIMTTWTSPKVQLPLFSRITAQTIQNFDAITTATPLANLKMTGTGGVNLLSLLLGERGGCIGEVSVLALLLGGAYLIVRKVISPRIPLAYIGTVAVLTLIFPRVSDLPLYSMLVEVMSGGLLLGAIFMATDYVTSPVTAKGQWIFGLGCGLLTVFIRYFGGYPEGVSYSILLMNLTVWLIDRKTAPKKFGEVAKTK